MAVIQQTTEKSKKTTQNHKAIKLRLAVLISVAAAVVSIKLFGVRYQSNDDATLANIAAGAYGDRLHMVYVNILFAAVLRPLYFITNASDTVFVGLSQIVDYKKKTCGQHNKCTFGVLKRVE